MAHLRNSKLVVDSKNYKETLYYRIALFLCVFYFHSFPIHIVLFVFGGFHQNEILVLLLIRHHHRRQSRRRRRFRLSTQRNLNVGNVIYDFA